MSKLNVLVYATGFDAHAYMRPIKVTGLNRTTIDEAWIEKIYGSYGSIDYRASPACLCFTGLSRQ